MYVLFEEAIQKSGILEFECLKKKVEQQKDKQGKVLIEEGLSCNFYKNQTRNSRELTLCHMLHNVLT